MADNSSTISGTNPTQKSSDRLESASILARPTIILWLIVGGMIFFFLPLYLFAQTAREDTENLESDFTSARAMLSVVPTAAPEIQRLLTPLAQAQQQNNQINGVYPTLVAPRANLPAVMTIINNYNPAEIVLTSVALANNRITLTGYATRDDTVIAYVHILEPSPLFTRVILQSAQRAPTVTPTPMVVSASTRIPASPVPAGAQSRGNGSALSTSMPVRFVITVDLKVTPP